MRGRIPLIVLVVGVIVGFAVQLPGQLNDETAFGDPNKEGRKRPLDLPVTGLGTSEEDEDSPEVISFYGGEFEGEGFFWLLDRSLSMNGEPIAALKEEVTSAIDQLSRNSEFALVAFAEDFVVFPLDERPMKASTGNKHLAKTWVNDLQLALWTCMAEPAGKIIDICNRSTKPVDKRLVIMVGDGMPYCGSINNVETDAVLENISSANRHMVRINTIFISNNDNQGQELFKEIAESYGGQFIFVD